MQLALEAIPISELKAGPNKVLEKIAERPMLLTQNGRSVAVLVSPESWNQREEQLAERRFTEAEMQAVALAYKKRAKGIEYETMDDLKARIVERARVASEA